MFRFGEPLYLYLLLLIPLLVAGHYLTNYLRIKRLKRYGDMELLKALMPDVSKYRPEVRLCLLLLWHVRSSVQRWIPASVRE